MQQIWLKQLKKNKTRTPFMYVSRLFTRIIGITEIEKENQQPAAMINNGLSLNKGLLELSFTMR